jgi:hypothetical protein
MLVDLSRSGNTCVFNLDHISKLELLSNSDDIIVHVISGRSFIIRPEDIFTNNEINNFKYRLMSVQNQVVDHIVNISQSHVPQVEITRIPSNVIN